MPRTALFIVTVMVPFILSCGNSPNDSNGNAFELEIAVVDGAGNPVSGLQVSAWNSTNAKQFLLANNTIGSHSSSGLRGDINCNGLANEVGDYVMFRNYFLTDESAFLGHKECSIVGGDVDGDGAPLTLSDFVYLISLIIGDAPPSPPRGTVFGAIAFESGTITVIDINLSALLLKFKGNVTPFLLINGLDIFFRYDVDSNSTIVLVSPSPSFDFGQLRSFTGDVLEANGELLSLSAADSDGRAVLPRTVAFREGLNAPIPNPSSPRFIVRALFPSPAAYTFTISNLEGELQHQVIDSATEAGFINFTWQPPLMTNTAYRIELELERNDTIITLDPEYAANVTFDSDDNVIGVTSTRGSVSTTEAWRFPSLFDLPELDETDSFGFPIGKFSYCDSVTVVLKRPKTSESKSYKIPLQNGINRAEIVWPY